jgi:hypothetical protein
MMMVMEVVPVVVMTAVAVKSAEYSEMGFEEKEEYIVEMKES